MQMQGIIATTILTWYNYTKKHKMTTMALEPSERDVHIAQEITSYYYWQPTEGATVKTKAATATKSKVREMSNLDEVLPATD